MKYGSKDQYIQIHVYLTPDYYEKVKLLAKGKNKSVSTLFRSLMEQIVDKKYSTTNSEHGSSTTDVSSSTTTPNTLPKSSQPRSPSPEPKDSHEADAKEKSISEEPNIPVNDIKKNLAEDEEKVETYNEEKEEEFDNSGLSTKFFTAKGKKRHI